MKIPCAARGREDGMVRFKETLSHRYFEQQLREVSDRGCSTTVARGGASTSSEPALIGNRAATYLYRVCNLTTTVGFIFL